MIEEAIIKPIEDYMAGNGELHDTSALPAIDAEIAKIAII